MEAINPELFGKDLKIQKAIEHARNVAATKAPVLIMGEPGTGKRSLGRFIHQISGRKIGPIAVVDCSLTAKEVEGALLGSKDEATQKFNRGAIESGNKGTLILANIEAIDENFQKRLYQIFQELEDYDLDVRLVATSTKNISKLVGAGRFFRPLFNVFAATQIFLRPLRERPEDVRGIAELALQDWQAEVGLTEMAVEKLTNHYWSHNLKELFMVLEDSLANVTGSSMDLEHLSLGEKKVVRESSVEGVLDENEIKLMSLKEAEKLLIRQALIHTSENRTQAAKILGVSIRTLRNKINEYRQEGSQFFVNLR